MPDSVRPAQAGALVVCLGACLACVTKQPATDVYDGITSPSSVTAGTSTTANPGDPTPPATGTVTVAYTNDLVPIFQSDCLRCHSGSRPDGNYNMSTYEGVIRAVVAGNSRSALVTTTQNRGSMYRYWSGNAAAKAELVRFWVVDNYAARSR